MVIGVIADGMPAFHHLSKHLRVLVDILSDHEERRLHAVTVENLQDSRRDLRDGSVVESEIHRLPLPADAVRVQAL